jgi:hypothetical protein
MRRSLDEIEAEAATALGNIIHFPIGIGNQIGKIGSKKGLESGIPQNSVEFRPEFPTKDKADFRFVVASFHPAGVNHCLSNAPPLTNTIVRLVAAYLH